MGPVQTAIAPEREVKAPPYKIVMGDHDPIMLECKSLNVSMSLQRLYRQRGDEDIQKREFGEVACGLRRETETARDAIDALAQAYAAGATIEPIKVLARREPSHRWGSTGFVVDGAIRVQAALRAGIAEIPVWLVTPHFPDTPLEGMFLHYNIAHGARLTTAERDSALRVIARRYMRDNLGKRDAHAFGRWLSERAPGLPAALVAEIVRNEFQVRTPNQWAEAERLGRGGAPTAEQLAKLRARNVALPENGRLSPGHIAKLLGISRAAVEKQFKRLGIEFKTMAKTKRTTDARRAAEPRPGGPAELDGDAPDATPELILESQIEPVDARATAQDLLAALKPIADNFDRAIHQINDWVLREAAEYRFEQAKLVWNVVDRFWDGLLAVNRAFRIYQDRHLAERDRPRLRDALSEAEATLATPRGRGKAKSARTGG
jgi:hypothetical protein